jgi:hypothetical protein
LATNLATLVFELAVHLLLAKQTLHKMHGIDHFSMPTTAEFTGPGQISPYLALHPIIAVFASIRRPIVDWESQSMI